MDKWTTFIQEQLPFCQFIDPLGRSSVTASIFTHRDVRPYLPTFKISKTSHSSSEKKYLLFLKLVEWIVGSLYLVHSFLFTQIEGRRKIFLLIQRYPNVTRYEY